MASTSTSSTSSIPSVAPMTYHRRPSSLYALARLFRPVTGSVPVSVRRQASSSAHHHDHHSHRHHVYLPLSFSLPPSPRRDSVLPLTVPNSTPDPNLSSNHNLTLSSNFVTSTATSIANTARAAAITAPRRKFRVAAALSTTTVACVLIMICVYILQSIRSTRGIMLLSPLSALIRRIYSTLCAFDWRSNAAFRVTYAMRVSIALSLALGIILGVGVGLISGLEPAVVIGVSASMAMGCVFVMSFAVLHGVNALRAVAFALFVSVCLPFGFGFGFGFGILVGVAFGLEDADEIREKTCDFVTNFSDFVRVVAAFTLEIL